jgi:hypothetical protein
MCHFYSILIKAYQPQQSFVFSMALDIHLYLSTLLPAAHTIFLLTAVYFILSRESTNFIATSRREYPKIYVKNILLYRIAQTNIGY